jgi:Flp pilus assembly protein TadD
LLAALVPVWLIAGCAATPESPLAAQPEALTPAVEENYRQALEKMQAGQWPEARELLEDMTSAHATLAGPWVNLGIVYTRLGEPEAAEHAFRQSIENNTGNPVAYNQLGILYRRTGRLEAAEEAYSAALGVTPDDPDTHWNLGILHDVYLPDARLALYHYERYQQLTGSDDPRLQAWITALRVRMPEDNMTAGVKP